MVLWSAFVKATAKIHEDHEQVHPEMFEYCRRLEHVSDVMDDEMRGRL